MATGLNAFDCRSSDAPGLASQDISKVALRVSERLREGRRATSTCALLGRRCKVHEPHRRGGILKSCVLI